MTRVRNYRRTVFFHLAFQVIFLLIFYFFGNTSRIEPTNYTGNILFGIIVLVPSLLWALLFYFEDWREPEPTRYLVTSALSGVAGTAVTVLVAEKYAFILGAWLHASWWSLILGSIFVAGILFSGLVYLILRYGYYYMREFDEPADGMVYGAFIGGGASVVESSWYLLHHTDFTLFAAAVTASTNALFYSSVGSLIGYFIGKEKFQKGKSTFYSLEAIVLGMILTGFWYICRELIFVSGSHYGLILSFTLTLLLSGAVLFVAYRKIQQLEKQDMHEDLHIPFEFELPVVVTLIGLLVVGFGVKTYFTKDNIFRDRDLGFSFAYPFWYRDLPVNPAALRVSTPVSTASRTVFAAGGNDAGRFVISVEYKASPVDLHQIDVPSLLGDATQRVFVNSEPISIGGRDGIRIMYGFLGAHTSAGKNFPDIYEAYCDAFPSGTGTLIFNLKATVDHFEQHQSEYDKLLHSLQWEAK